MKISLYRITNLINKKQYIGITNETAVIRFMRHKRETKQRPYRPLRDDIEKYGVNNFLIETLVVCGSIEYANELEIKAISQFKTLFSQGGYNLSRGGHKSAEIVRDETRFKMSQAKIGKKRTQETKDKISKTLREHVFSKDALEKMDKARRSKKGKPLTNELKNKLSISAKKRWKEISIEEKQKIYRAVSESNKGKVLSEQSKAKMSESRKIILDIKKYMGIKSTQKTNIDFKAIIKNQSYKS